MLSVKFVLYHEDSDSCVAVVKKITENVKELNPSHCFNIDCNFDATAIH